MYGATWVWNPSMHDANWVWNPSVHREHKRVSGNCRRGRLQEEIPGNELTKEVRLSERK